MHTCTHGLVAAPNYGFFFEYAGEESILSGLPSAAVNGTLTLAVTDVGTGSSVTREVSIALFVAPPLTQKNQENEVGICQRLG